MHFSTPRRSKNTRKYKDSLIRFNAQQFVELARIQCTLSEIAHFFHITMDELDKYCQKEFAISAKYALKEFSSEGKISLKRSQFKTAIEKQNPIMQIWLGRNYLDQCEDPSKRAQEEQRTETLREIVEAVKKI